MQWVPHCLTAEHKYFRLDIATLLKESFNIEDQAFLCRIVAIDETCIRDFEPELKSQSNEWRAAGFPRPKKFWRAQSKVKQIMMFDYGHQGVNMTERVPCERSVTGVYYCAFMQKLCRKMHKDWPQLLVAGPLILHDNSRPHITDVVTKKNFEIWKRKSLSWTRNWTRASSSIWALYDVKTTEFVVVLRSERIGTNRLIGITI